MNPLDYTALLRPQPTCFDFDLDLRKTDKAGFFTVINPIYVFKKVYGTSGRDKLYAIANLIIPPGATIFLGRERRDLSNWWGRPRQRISHKALGKMRASEAYVHSIVIIHNKLVISSAESWYTSKSHFWQEMIPFMYQTGKTVYPTEPYSYMPEECESGIHFFLSLESARNF